MNLGCRRSGASVFESAIRLGCRNRPRRRGASETMVSVPAYRTPFPIGRVSPLAVGTGTPARSRAAARSRGGCESLTVESPFPSPFASPFAPLGGVASAVPNPAAPSHWFKGTPAAAMASTMPVRLSVGGAGYAEGASALRDDSSASTSDVAHSSSSTCTRVGSEAGGGFARSRRRSAAAVSSLAAPPAPAAASSGRISAGASITGKCSAMKRAASGRAEVRVPAAPPPNPAPSANPAGRKYPSAGLVGAAVPRLRNRPGACSASALYRGRTYSADAGWPPDTRASNEDSAEEEDPGISVGFGSIGLPSASSAGGGGAPSATDLGHKP